MMYCIVSVFLLFVFWCPCMVIDASVPYNGGLLPDILLLTQCYYYYHIIYSGTRVDAMKKFCLSSV